MMQGLCSYLSNAGYGIWQESPETACLGVLTGGRRGLGRGHPGTHPQEGVEPGQDLMQRGGESAWVRVQGVSGNK